MRLAAGTKLGPYEIVSPLGVGGMGEVYRARDTRLERTVAIKILPSHLSESAEARQRFEREARAISSLNHPNICTVHDVGSQGGTEYLVMEYLEGDTLASRLMRGALPVDRLLQHGIEVSDALDVAHHRGIIHRDLKPSNIFLTSHGEAKVLDFGLAKIGEEAASGISTIPNIAALTSPGATMGTVAYMSPEQARGEEVDVRTDIFSLGAVLYEAATGQVAFSGKTSAMVFKAILDVNPPSITQANPIIPARLDEIVSKALEKDRDLRYQSAADLRTDLKRLKRDSESGRLAVRSVGMGEKTPTRRRWILEAIVAGLLVIVVAALTWWISRRGANQGQFAPMTITPLTSYPGDISVPRFSPDGNQVAFLWDRGEGKGFDVYVKLIGETTSLRLTNTPAEIDGVAWSPDGHRIAFLRAGQAAGVFIVSALGGPERRLAEVRFSGTGYLGLDPGLDWSPDGKWLAFPDKNSAGEPFGIFLISPDTGERRRLTTPPSSVSDSQPVFSPDANSLVFVRSHGGLSSDVFVAPVQGGESRKVSALDAVIPGLDWTADGQRIVFAALTREGDDYRLWQMAISGGKPERLSQLGSQGASWPTVSRHGNRLAYIQSVDNSNIWQLRLGSFLRRSGSPVKLISSTRAESGPQYSPDGKRIVFVSNRSGSAQIWVSEADGSSPAQLTFMKANDTGTPHWSPDGRRIAFDSSVSGMEGVYLISADGGAPQPLVVDSFGNNQPSFSRDGHWIYFVSDRSGTDEIWKVAASNSQPLKVTSHGGHMPMESIDGKFLYYNKAPAGEGPPDSAGLWRMPTAGGEETLILKEGIYRGGLAPDFFWALSDAGIYFIDDTSPRPNLKLLNPDTGHTTTVTALDKTPFCCNPALAASADGHSILYSEVDSSSRDIMLVENFH